MTKLAVIFALIHILVNTTRNFISFSDLTLTTEKGEIVRLQEKGRRRKTRQL